MRSEKAEMNVGETIFSEYERLLRKGNSFALVAEERAADIVLNSQFVSQPLIQRGIIRRGEVNKLLLPFSGNLAAQKYADKNGKLYKVDLPNANKRAESVLNYSIGHFSALNRLMKERGVKDLTLFYGLRDAALIESVFTNYIAKVPMSKHAEAAAAIGLIRRFENSVKGFKPLMRTFDVDTRDNVAVRQFVDTIGFRDICAENWKNDSYFRRRITVIDNLADAAGKETDDAIRFSKAADKTFTENIFLKGVKRLGLNRQRLAALLLLDDVGV